MRMPKNGMKKKLFFKKSLRYMACMRVATSFIMFFVNTELISEYNVRYVHVNVKIN